MPNVSLLERVPIEEIQRQLNLYGSLQGAADHYGVSKRTILRYIDGKLEAVNCWRPVRQTFDATFNTALQITPVSDQEGQSQ